MAWFDHLFSRRFIYLLIKYILLSLFYSIIHAVNLTIPASFVSALFIQSESATTSITSLGTSVTSVVTTANDGSSFATTANASTSIAIARPNHQSKLPNSFAVASSLPDHFSGGFESSNFITGSITSSISNQLFTREQTPPIGNNSLGTAPSSNNNAHVLGVQPNSSAPGPGPIARPRSYSSSNTNSSNISATANSFSESLLSNLFKNAEDKQNIYMNGPQSSRKLSTPTSSLFSSGNNSSLFTSLTSNRDNINSLFGAPGYPTTADTVESCLGLAVEDLSLDDIQLEASLERDLGPNTVNNTVNNSGLGDDSTSSVTNCLLGRSPSTLLGSAPVNIPGNKTQLYHKFHRIIKFRLTRRQIGTSIDHC